VIRGELEDQALLERVLNEQEITTVIHLGAQAVVGTANRNPVSTFESNVRGTWSLLEACRRSPLVCAIVLASSDKAYGEQPMLPYTEDMPLLARNPYDVSKSCAEMVAQSYVTAFRLQIAIARCGNFFGAGDLNWNRIVPGTIRSILRGERPVIRSDGTFIRDYFYAADGALAYLLLAEALTARPELAGEAFNFSHEKPLTVLEVVDTILRLMGSELRPDVKNSAMNEIHRQYLSAAKARRVLGWEPKNSLEEGLDATIRWYESLLRS
jgi:CDP-glucose 4,6-dehydratase